MNNEEKDCPLSSKDWILFLSGEITNLENEGHRNLNTTFPVFVMFTTAMAIIISSIFSTANIDIPPSNKANILFNLLYAYQILSILFTIFLFVFIILLIDLIVKLKKVNNLRKIRNNILEGSLKNTDEIHEKWKNVMQLKYIELLKLIYTRRLG